MKTITDLTNLYDAQYAKPNWFGHSATLHLPVLRAVLAKAGLPAHATILDVGCGQGQFTHWLAQLGLAATGVDPSPVAIASAGQTAGARFICASAEDISTRFDAVFVRDFSPYDTRTFATDRSMTDRLLARVKPGGVLIWIYSSRQCPASSPTWRHHTLAETRRHFSPYPTARTWFTLRLETRLGSWMLNPWCSWLATQLARITGRRGDLIAIIPQQPSA